jgi:hypothetical protein
MKPEKKEVKPVAKPVAQKPKSAVMKAAEIIKKRVGK